MWFERWCQVLQLRLRALFKGKDMDRELDEELRYHVERQTEENLRRGMTPCDARTAALCAMGGVEQQKEECRDRRGLNLIDHLVRDVRYAVRTLVHAPAFTAVVLITLALGIGPTAAIFSAVNAVLLNRPPVSDPDRIVNVYTQYAARATANPGAGDQVGGSSYPDYVDLRDSGVLEGVAAFADTGLSLDVGGVTDRIDAQIVSGNYFDVLGVRPVIGRAFRKEEDSIGSLTRVVVLSHRTWQQRFGGDAGAVGRTIALNGNSYTVIGIAPPGFSGIDLSETPEVWVPMALQEEVRPASAGALRQRLGSARLLGARDVRWLDMVGRRRRDMSVAKTAAALDVIGHRLATAYPESNRDMSATALPLGAGPGLRRDAQPVLGLLSAAVILVLMISCANVASLQLARAVTRRREVAVRMAIGAGRGQLVRQWLTEAVILGVVGAVGGLIIGRLSTPILYGFGIPDGVDLSMNPRVLAFTLTIGFATGLIFGLAPIVQLVRRDTLAALRDEGGAVATGIRATRLRSTFVVVQVALSLVLLVGAGLFVRTLQQAYAVDLGYQVDRMLLADIAPDDSYSPETGEIFYDNVLDRLNSLPGVVAAGAARVTVLSGSSRTLPVSFDGQPMRPDRSNIIPVRANVVSDRYLEAMGIPIVRGRGFQPSDVREAPRVAIVSRSLAERLWPGLDPIGQTFLSQARAEVVGVVPDTVYLRATEREPRPFFYLPLTQNYEYAVTLHVRTVGDPLTMLPAIRRTVRELDPRLALTRPRRLADEFDQSVKSQRTMAAFAGALSVVALLLTAVGVYGVVAYATRQRTVEVGLRLALGATRVSILNMVVVRGVRLVVIGAALGLAGAFMGVRFVQGQLFGVEPTDPLTWLSVFALLALVGLVACLIPAQRAMRVDPAAALRTT